MLKFFRCFIVAYFSLFSYLCLARTSVSFDIFTTYLLSLNCL
uniref:Uncharacterized protein n=1 Tax=Rhizophora mucronata TaxID=61149 RepID=A0A2P2NI54_RHIMU